MNKTIIKGDTLREYTVGSANTQLETMTGSKYLHTVTADLEMFQQLACCPDAAQKMTDLGGELIDTISHMVHGWTSTGFAKQRGRTPDEHLNALHQRCGEAAAEVSQRCRTTSYCETMVGLCYEMLAIAQALTDGRAFQTPMRTTILFPPD